MADISKIKIPDGTSLNIKDTTARTKIGNMTDKLVYPVIGTQTAATAQFLGAIDLDNLYDGLTIAYYLPYAGKSGTNATLNLTLSDGTTTGAIDVYETGTTRLTTQYAAGSTIILTYWSAGSINVSGTATTSARWTHADYNSDANSVGYQLRHNSGTYTAFANIYRYMLLLSKSSTQVLPVNSVSNSIATTKALTTESFNPFGEILYYSGTDTVATGGQTVSSLWQQYAFDLRYSFNCGKTLTSNKDVYIVAVPQSDGYAKLASSPLAQELPNTDDGKIYIYLGHAYSTYQIEMHMNHPIYWYKNGKICLYTKNDVYIAGNDITLTSTTNNNEIKIAAMLQKYWKTSISKTPYSNELEVSTTFSSTISNSDTDPHPGVTNQIDLVGASVAGKEYTIDDETITAGAGAEVFNCYGVYQNKATGEYSHAEGMSTIASGNESHAEGYETKASGLAAHAEGISTIASNSYAHAEGDRTIASGYAAHAEGNQAKATGSYSHAEGFRTIAAGTSQHVQGKYNIEDSNNIYSFIIGNGENENNRSNAFAIDWNGKIYVNNATVGVDINALASTANAAAPQSTTYTKTEVNTALAAKLNTADVDNALSSTSTNPVQNKVVQAPVARLVDAEAKNKLNHTAYTRTVNGVIYTVNADRSITITSDGTNTQSLLYLTQNAPLAAGSYILSGCTGGSTTKYDLRVKVGNTITNNYNGGTAFSADGTPIEASIVVRASQTLNITIKPMISTAADYAISSEYVPYAKSNYQLTKDVRPIPKLVDDGAKNLLKNTAPYGSLVRTNLTFTHNDDDTYVVNATSANTANTDLYVAADMPIKAGTYVLSGCPAGGNNSNTYKLQIAGIGYDLGDGLTFTIAQDTTISVYIRIWNGYVPNNIVFKPMICTTEDYVISSEYMPYAPSNRELYEEIEDTNATVLPFLSGKKVYEHYFGSTSGSGTYTVNKSDFGSGNLTNCGVYLIYRVSWATAPAISIYALAYSGGRVDYTTLQKIAGNDFDISVAQGVLSFTTAGKIQIIAVT